jgi:hypothetical protein
MNNIGNDIYFTSPRDKSLFYIHRLPDIAELIRFFNDDSMIEYLSHEESRDIFLHNRYVFNEILDNTDFINAIYDYIWACMYSYSVVSRNVSNFIKYITELINERTRPNYIIIDCNPELKRRGTVEVDEYIYTCGRALGKVLDSSKGTRLVIYNTISTENDYMDEDYFNMVKTRINKESSKRSRSRSAVKLPTIDEIESATYEQPIAIVPKTKSKKTHKKRPTITRPRLTRRVLVKPIGSNKRTTRHRQGKYASILNSTFRQYK